MSGYVKTKYICVIEYSKQLNETSLPTIPVYRFMRNDQMMLTKRIDKDV